MRCLQCGNDNLEPAHLCQVCGAALPESPLDIGLIRPDVDSEQPLTSMLYQALIGPVHTDYYLQHFARFDAAGKSGVTWNWAAFFNPLGWLAFRRMWTEALIFATLSVVLALALFGVLPLLWRPSQELLLTSLAIYLLALALLPGLWANAMYYRHCNRQVTQVLVAAPDIRQTREQLAARSSTWGRGGIAAVVAALAWLVTGAVAAWLVVAAGGMTVAQPVQPAARPAAVAASSAASTPTATAAAASQPVVAASMPVAASAPTPAIVVPASSAAMPPASAPAPAPAAATKATPVLAPTASAASDGDKQKQWIVAVGQFAQEQNASRVYDKLAAAGLPVHRHTVHKKTGTLLAIQVGPFDSPEDARQSAQQVQALGLSAIVMKR